MQWGRWASRDGRGAPGDVQKGADAASRPERLAAAGSASASAAAVDSLPKLSEAHQSTNSEDVSLQALQQPGTMRITRSRARTPAGPWPSPPKTRQKQQSTRAKRPPRVPKKPATTVPEVQAAETTACLPPAPTRKEPRAGEPVMAEHERQSVQEAQTVLPNPMPAAPGTQQPSGIRSPQATLATPGGRNFPGESAADKAGYEAGGYSKSRRPLQPATSTTTASTSGPPLLLTPAAHVSSLQHSMPLRIMTAHVDQHTVAAVPASNLPEGLSFAVAFQDALWCCYARYSWFQ